MPITKKKRNFWLISGSCIASILNDSQIINTKGQLLTLQRKAAYNVYLAPSVNTPALTVCNDCNLSWKRHTQPLLIP